MSFFEDASLVLIPSAQKTSKVYSVKPTDGTGDLTFTRSNDTATRVGPDGLIEKVRTNLLVQSNTFNTTWAPSTAITVTSGQSGYDGTSNAWLLERSDASARYIFQNITQAASTYTFSVYAKAETVNWLWLYSSDGTNLVTAYFDLATGALGTTSGVITSKIESVGNGWYRCSISYSDDITSVRIYPAVANGSITGGISPAGIFIQNAMLEVGDVMTDYIATTTAAVSVGPVANVPRLDYLNSSCPRLLLEPQRTNLFQYSEQLDDAYWSKIGAITVSANNATSPDGYQNADLVTGAASGARIQRAFTGLTAGTRTLSCFVKAGTGTEVTINTYDGIVDKGAAFNVVTGVVTSTSAGATATITNYGSGWYRLTHTYTSAGTSYSCQFFFDAGLTYQVYGFQFEDSASYATSYIPTLAASVTRGADFAQQTGITSLIGQTEGTLFLDFESGANDSIDYALSINDGTTTNRIAIFRGSANNVIGQVRLAAVTQASIVSATITPNTRQKCAIAYKLNDVAFYVNGVQIGVDTSASIPACSAFSSSSGGAGGSLFGRPVNQALLFKTRLSNSELAQLTTI